MRNRAQAQEGRVCHSHKDRVYSCRMQSNGTFPKMGLIPWDLNNAPDIGAFGKDGSMEHHAVRQLSFPSSGYQSFPSIKENRSKCLTSLVPPVFELSLPRLRAVNLGSRCAAASVRHFVIVFGQGLALKQNLTHI